MLNGLDLFSGIGGLSIALREWVKPVCYCEIEPYCQAVLLSRMHTGELPRARIWDDIKSFQISWSENNSIDLIYGGFPCQDISIAGHGKGLEGERSGLFWEMHRLAEKIKPKFIFIENVPAICTRGGREVVQTIAKMGYDCRWCVISAASVGALQRRDRWFLLCHSNGKPSQQTYTSPIAKSKQETTRRGSSRQYWPFESRIDWQETVSTMGKCSDGIPFHVDRLRALGNAVVPEQAREAFKILMGLK
jgi:DNA (cytosine-5)-methyltransferase 1